MTGNDESDREPAGRREEEAQASEEERAVPAADDLGGLRSVWRFVLGSAVLATERLFGQLRDAAEPGEPAREPPEGGAKAEDVEPDEEESRERLRLALLGLMVEAERALAAGAEALGRVRESAGRDLDRAMKGLGMDRAAGPVNERLDGLRARVDAELDRLVSLGRQERDEAREFAAEKIDRVSKDVIEGVAGSPKISSVVWASSRSVGERAVDRLRAEARAADDRVERIVWRVVRPRRRPSSTGAPPSGENGPETVSG